MKKSEKNETQTIRIISDYMLYPDTVIKLHLTYNNSLTLKELSETLDLINKSINDVNRENGIGNTIIEKQYATEVSKVESGSIVLYIVTNIVVPITLSVLANFISERLKTLGAKKDKEHKEHINGYPVLIIVNGELEELEIYIDKPEQK